MNELLHSSLIWQLWQGFVRLCRQSNAARLLRAPFFVWLWGCFTRPARVLGSGLHRRLERLNQRLWRFGQRWGQVLEESFPMRVHRALYRALGRSRVLGWMFRGGTTAVLCYVLGSYGIIDYLLRDVLSIPVFSSLWDELLLVLAIAVVLKQRIHAPAPMAPRTNAVDVGILQFLIVGVGLAIIRNYAGLYSITIDGFRATMQGILWFYVVTRLLRTNEDLDRLYRTLVFWATVIALHGIVQYILAVPIPSHWVDAAEQSVRTRVFSIFGSPNIMGDYMLMFAPMALAMAYVTPDWRKKVLYVGITGCMCLSCLFTMSRGAWVGLFAAAVVFCLLADLRLLVLLIAGAFASLLLPFVSSRIMYLFTGDFAASNARGGRAMRWQKAMGYLMAVDPVFGIGFGGFGGAIAMQNKVRYWWTYFYVDNYYMKILAENGYVGLVSYCLMLVSMLFAGLRSWVATRHSKRNPMTAGLLAGLVGVLVHCYLENIFEEPYMLAYFWIMAGMLVWMGLQKKSEQ